MKFQPEDRVKVYGAFSPKEGGNCCMLDGSKGTIVSNDGNSYTVKLDEHLPVSDHYVDLHVIDQVHEKQLRFLGILVYTFTVTDTFSYSEEWIKNEGMVIAERNSEMCEYDPYFVRVTKQDVGKYEVKVYGKRLQFEHVVPASLWLPKINSGNQKLQFSSNADLVNWLSMQPSKALKDNYVEFREVLPE